jgi:hypothetical protein
MPGLPEVPNLDPNAPPPVKTAFSMVVTDPALRIKAAPGEPPAAASEAAAAKARAAPAPEKTVVTPPAPPADTDDAAAAAPGSEVQDSVEEVLQHTSAQTLKLSHLEDVLAALNRTLGDLQDEMHAGFAELRAVLESSVTNALGNRETAIREKQPVTQSLEALEEQQLAVKKRQNLVLVIGALQALLLVVALVALFTSRAEVPRRETIEPTPPAASTPLTTSPLGDVEEPAGLPGDEAKHRDAKKKKGRKR